MASSYLSDVQQFDNLWINHSSDILFCPHCRVAPELLQLKDYPEHYHMHHRSRMFADWKGYTCIFCDPRNCFRWREISRLAVRTQHTLPCFQRFLARLPTLEIQDIMELLQRTQRNLTQMVLDQADLSNRVPILEQNLEGFRTVTQMSLGVQGGEIRALEYNTGSTHSDIRNRIDFEKDRVELLTRKNNNEKKRIDWLSGNNSNKD